jgi:hypothetical protein
MIDCAYKLHPHLKKYNVKLVEGNACELVKVIQKTYSPDQIFWSHSTTKIICMCMNTFGILPEQIRNEVVSEMFRAAGGGGKVIIGCWHKDSLRVGYEEFYSKFPQLCGECREQDFDFENGNFKCSTSDYTSHWWSEEELSGYLRRNYPGDSQKL